MFMHTKAGLQNVQTSQLHSIMTNETIAIKVEGFNYIQQSRGNKQHDKKLNQQSFK